MDSIRQAWDWFELSYVPPDASDDQRDDMRLAFYSGAHAILTITYQVGRNLPDAQRRAAMDKIVAEMCAFQAARVTSAIIDNVRSKA